MSGSDAIAQLSVDPELGLSTAEVEARRVTFGRNELQEPPKRPGWKVFLDQFRDFLIMILIGAAVVGAVVSRELKTPIIVAVVVLLNATLGFIQQGRAEKSLEALKKMLDTRVRVRRDGRVSEVSAGELVPGDIVLIEAGNRVPADGRLLMSASVEIEEAALTGESVPSPKDATPTITEGAGIGDRTNMVFSNTQVTRGRGEFVVTETGMNTEIGRIADLLRGAENTSTPLQDQLNHLGHTLAKLAGAAVVLYFIVGLARREPFGDVVLEAVALAVAAIPEGLPAVVAVTLAIGTASMAKQNAIVKKLAATETLGSVSTICSDKTGTLTLNQMTARGMLFNNRTYGVSGEGYVPNGKVHDEASPEGHVVGDLARIMIPIALCNDSTLNGSELIGDPTEGALVTLAAKGGIDVDQLRADRPRIAEVPFDSATKFMATMHHYRQVEGDEIIRVYVKGAPDVLISRCAEASWEGGVVVEMTDAIRQNIIEQNSRYAHQGMRVIAVARRDISTSDFSALTGRDDVDTALAGTIHGLTFVGLVAIVDPPRPEAKAAIAECHAAGIDVKMITGDHLETATAIGRELGITGNSIGGADLDKLDADQLREVVKTTGVFARVSPEHKLRIVEALQANGHVVSMTGDGVNDAPALKRADMGVAMGITGTEVTKEAADMILTDDNFTTIVRAVRNGRTIYDNIIKFVRFQLSTNIGAILTLVSAQAFGWAKPLTAIQVLWVNIIMDGPPAMALGIDPASPDVMERKPRSRAAKILGLDRLTPLVINGIVMAVGTLTVMQMADEWVGATEAEALTMAFTTFVFFQFWNALAARSETQSVFNRYTFTNAKLWISLGVVVALQVIVTVFEVFHGFIDVVPLKASEWLLCVAIASSLLVVDEVRKFFVRARA
jgi:Ca2+-transporting ATPase